MLWLLPCVFIRSGLWGHRGTHGLCDKWKALPGQGEDMVKTVYEKAKLEQKKPNQQKRLSWDEFEKGPFIECKILFLLGDADNHDSSYYYEHL